MRNKRKVGGDKKCRMEEMDRQSNKSTGETTGHKRAQKSKAESCGEREDIFSMRKEGV